MPDGFNKNSIYNLPVSSYLGLKIDQPPDLSISDIEVPVGPSGRQLIPDKLGNPKSAFPNKGQNKEIAPGVTALDATPVAPVEEKGLPKTTVDRLVQSAASPIEGVKSIQLSDGTKIEGITPADMIQTGGGTENATSRIPGQNQSFLDQASSFISDPRFGYITGKLAQAVNPFSPGAQQAGQIGVDLAKNEASQAYAQALRGGGDLSAPQFNILSQEEKQSAVTSYLAEKNQALAERRQATLEPYYEAQTEQAKATAASQLTREDKLENEAIDRATRLQVARIGDNNWMNIGQGHVFNIDTGEIKKAYDYQSGGTSVGNINSAEFNNFLKLVSTSYLPMAVNNRKAQIAQEQGPEFAESVETINSISQSFVESNTGNPNFSMIYHNLSADQRIKLAVDLQKYVTNVESGLGPAGTFLQQEAQRNAPILQQIIDLGGNIAPDGVITFPDGGRFKLLPNGQLQELK